MKGCFMFHGGVCFSDQRGFVFKLGGGGTPWGASVLVLEGGGSKKIVRWGNAPSTMPCPPTMGNLGYKIL